MSGGHERHPRLTTGDAAYGEMLVREAVMWADPFLDLERAEAMVPASMQRIINELLTGRLDLHWFDELVSRGPFGEAAALGGTGGYLEVPWLARSASRTLDVYELSDGVLDNVRKKLVDAGVDERARLIPADLNLHELPTNRYDIVWSAGALHHLLELEHAADQVQRALRPGGIFAFYEYVAERRVQFDPLRIRLSEEAARDVPDRFFRGERRIASPDLEAISPFEAIRSDEIERVVSARFESVCWRRAAILVPLAYAVDLPAIAEQEPALLERLMVAERQGAASLPGCVCYAVFRKR